MIRDFIINWFVDHGTLSGEQLKECMDENYFEAGIIDSFDFLSLLGACEESLGLTFQDEDFSDDAIFTINGMIGLMEKKKSLCQTGI